MGRAGDAVTEQVPDTGRRLVGVLIIIIALPVAAALGLLVR